MISLRAAVSTTMNVFLYLTRIIFVTNIHYINGDYMYYVNTFFLFSILGHFIEDFFYVTKDSGIFFGWWTPIYGIGVLVEKQENEDKKLKEQEEIKKSKVDSEIPLVEDNIKSEEVKQN